jgi:hypothetical protein
MICARATTSSRMSSLTTLVQIRETVTLSQQRTVQNLESLFAQDRGVASCPAYYDHNPNQDDAWSLSAQANRRPAVLLEGPQRLSGRRTRSGKTFLIVRAIVMRALQAKGSRRDSMLMRHAPRSHLALFL